jgi:16S rRNA G966 N2-methylase RsmD
MVESDTAAVAALRQLRDRLKATSVRIHVGDARHVLKRLSETRFDLVFLDPPFGQDWLPDLLSHIWPLLNDDGLVYVEAEKQIDPPSGFIALRQDRAGAVHYQLLQRAALQT